MPSDSDRASAPAMHFKHTEIKGRFDQFRSSFWGGAMAALGLRYLSRPLTGNWWDENKAGPGWLGYLKKYSYSLVAGAIMYVITGFYAKQTYKDMHNIFSEALAWEFNKKPEEVGVRDFLRSDNAIINRTKWNFFKYNSRRFGTQTLFFLPFLLPWFFKSEKLKGHRLVHPETPIDLGVGANAFYLVTDIFTRKETFFEKLQAFIDRKINHTDSLGDQITAADLISLYDRHARDNNPKHPISERMDTPAWQDDKILFARMAELMNQTYGNMPKKEKADFTVPKLIYLLGSGLVKTDNLAVNLAYVEVANSCGIPAAKEVAQAIKSGAPLETILQKFPVNLSFAQPKEAEGSEKNNTNQQDGGKFAQQVSSNRNGINPNVPAASKQEQLAKTAEMAGPRAI